MKSKKDKLSKLENAMRKNLKKRKVFQKKQKKIINKYVNSTRYMDKKNVQGTQYD